MSEHEWASRSLDSILAPKGYGILRAYNGKQALERTAGSNVDAVFVDRSLPDMSGAEVCRELAGKSLVAPSAPIMMVTSGFVTREQRIEALNAGAWDLVGLPVDAEELLLRMDRFIRAKMEADRAQEDALIDAVTGLYSWEGVSRRIREIAASAERFDRPLACVVFAPEGGEEPDESAERSFLALVAERLRGSVRGSDVLGRIGPREFAVIAPDTSPEGAKVLADRLRGWSPAIAGEDAAGMVQGRGGGADDGNGGAARSRPSARAGVCAIRSLKEAGLDPLELVVQATLASREGPPAPLH